MAKTRVHELAKEFGVESKRILAELNEMGEFVKSASSVVELPAEAALRRRLAGLKKPPDMPEPRAQPHVQGAAPLKPHAGASLTRESSSSTSVSGGGVPRHPTENPFAGHQSLGVRKALATPPARPPQQLSGPVETSRTGNRAQVTNARTVNMHSLSSEADLRTVLRSCKRAAERSDGRKLVFDFKDATGFYPSISVPAVAIIQHFREAGVAVEMVNLPAIADVMQIRNPMQASSANLADLNEPLSRVWAYFDHQEANGLTSAFMDCMRRKVECKPGVLEALEWCLYEVLDNVMQHSNAGVGYAMLQLHPRSKRLAVCVSDTGIGVQRSLASANAYRPRTAFDALTMAVKEGVTRNKATNQGNGLFGLLKIVEQNGGKLDMRSGRGRMVLEGDRVRGANDQEFPGPDSHGTTVGFQLKVDKPVSIGSALNYERANLFLESLESDEGEHVIDIRNQAGGAGSRLAARELKTLIVNVLNEGVPHVVLDFDGQAVVSSSFADEVIGKMFAQMGFNTFNQRIKLRNMNSTVATLVDRAIARRMAQP